MSLSFRNKFRVRCDPSRYAGGGGSTGLIQPSDFSYLGAFKVPLPSSDTFEYSNGVIAYYPTNNSLFLNSHVTTPSSSPDKTAELTIVAPKFGTPGNISTLNRAAFVTNSPEFKQAKDVTQAGMGGMCYIPEENRVYYCATDDYNDNLVPAMNWFDAATRTPGTGGYYLSTGSTTATIHQYKWSRYITQAPQAWADANLGGRTILVGRHRGNQNVDGPTMYALFRFGSTAASSAVLPARALMKFGPDGGEAAAPDWAPTNNYQGLAWLTASSGRQCVALCGTFDTKLVDGHCGIEAERNNQSTGWYYGYSNWVRQWQCEDMTVSSISGLNCLSTTYPPVDTPLSSNCGGDPGRGWRYGGTPKVEIRLYDPADLAAVFSSNKARDQVFYYASYDISTIMLRSPVRFAPDDANSQWMEQPSMAFDSTSGKLYLCETQVEVTGAGNKTPVIHVFQLA